MTKRIKAFEYAFAGIYSGLKKEVHLKLHFLSAFLVIAMGLYFKITQTEWLVIIACCSAVLAAELINTAIEKTCDLVSLEFHPAIKYIKDMSAGAVLILSIGAAIVGCIVFWKYLV